MDKNLFIAVAASIVVYAVWFGYVEKRIAPPAPAVSGSTATAAGSVSAAVPPTSSASPSPSSSSLPVAAPTPAEKDKTFAVSFANAELQIRSHGAAITSWKFHGPRGVVELVRDPNPGLLSTFPDLAFSPVGGETPLLFEAKLPNGLRVLKQFIPGEDATLPKMTLTVENPTGKPVDAADWTISLGPGLGTVPAEEKDNAKMTRSLGLLPGENGLNGKVDVFKNPGEHDGNYQWVGVDNRYFLSAVLPRPGEFSKVDALNGHTVVVTVAGAQVPAHGKKTWDVDFYIGAKGHTWLSRYKRGLERSVDFGFFAQLGRAVLWCLNHIHAACGNWGWSIIILTIIIQIALFPLTFQSLKSMAAMKKLQPEIAKLQQRYSKDPARLNQEMMGLYKKHGANPLGGCLPMIIQLPIFYALYTALRNAWELHGAGWALWIHDLSAKDPYYVLPIVMGGIMFAQNKMSPQAPADPTQQQMMTFMPIIFTVMFINFPSGLVLYYLTNSLTTFIIQLALRDKLGLSAASAKAA